MWTFGKCASSKRPALINFAETCRADDSLCGPKAVWWEGRPPKFEVVEDEPGLAWEEDEEELSPDSLDERSDFPRA